MGERMSKVTSLSIELRMERLRDALDVVASGWTDAERERFQSEWKAMEAAGAEAAEVKCFGNRIVGFPSEEFTRHCEAWGVVLA